MTVWTGTPNEPNSATAPVLEAVGDQLSLGQVIEPRQLPAAVPAGVERGEALIASLQLNRDGENSDLHHDTRMFY